ncbi:MAG: STAS domain-containing protein [Micromonosporaceae bacterium]|nr:STAS domain-containing protein [Micromonosporaceae bacterium]
MERPELTITVRRTPGEIVLVLAGEVDLSTAGQLSAVVTNLLIDPPPRLVLDMADVTFCDSQGLGTLVVLSRRAALAQSCLVLTNVAEFLMRVLDITGLRPALMIH